MALYPLRNLPFADALAHLEARYRGVYDVPTGALVPVRTQLAELHLDPDTPVTLERGPAFPIHKPWYDQPADPAQQSAGPLHVRWCVERRLGRVEWVGIAHTVPPLGKVMTPYPFVAALTSLPDDAPQCS